jgi:ABC-type uncharacterized transport system ATPase subunit
MFHLDIHTKIDIAQHPASRFHPQAMNQAVASFALETRGPAKNFEQPAVDGLDLRVRTGEFYTLLGPNGAGKTTTLRMVTGLLKPDRGSISVFGIDAAEAQAGQHAGPSRAAGSGGRLGRRFQRLAASEMPLDVLSAPGADGGSPATPPIWR